MKTFNIFRWFRNQTGVRPKRVLPVERPPPVFKAAQRAEAGWPTLPEQPIDRLNRLDPWHQRIFEPTHEHTSGQRFMLTDTHERENFPGKNKVTLLFFEDADGKCFVCTPGTFEHAFRELPL